MNAQTERLHVAGAAGAIEVAIDQPPGFDTPRGTAVLAHPHPLFGGTMDNKVVQTMARAFLQMGYRTVRFNFRGVGSTEGVHDEGRGESDDLLAVVATQRLAGLPLVLGGFSFGPRWPPPGWKASSAPNACCWSDRPRSGPARPTCPRTPWSSTAKPTTLCPCRPCSTGSARNTCPSP
jgi:predicted alpha/beta-hydrolase family hydrolase